MRDNAFRHTAMRVTTKRYVRMAGAAIAGAAGAALLASCGVVGGASAADDLSEAEKSRIAEEFRDCLAEGGLEGRVSFDGGSIDIEVGGPGDIDEEEMLATEAKCEQILEDLDGGQQMDPEDEARFIDASADIQRCIGDKGYIVTVVDGGIDLNSDDQGEDFDEAEYLEAEDECLQEVVPDLYEKYGEDG